MGDEVHCGEKGILESMESKLSLRGAKLFERFIIVVVLNSEEAKFGIPQSQHIQLKLG